MITLTIGTRRSQLALWQSNHIRALLETTTPSLTCQLRHFVTQGDKTLDKALPQIGGKGLFTAELEQALLSGEIDLAVHSLKDLPTENPAGLTIGAIPERADVRDVLIAAHPYKLGNLPLRAVVGTSSLRRQAQLLNSRPDLNVQSIRGNVDTRIKKMQNGDYDAIVLAAAGVTRIGLDQHIQQWFPTTIMLPAPGQGALAVQCRSDDTQTLQLLASVEHTPTRLCTLAERTFLAALGGGCSLPVGAYATIKEKTLALEAVVASPNGRSLITVFARGTDPKTVGQQAAQKALAKGAAEVIANV